MLSYLLVYGTLRRGARLHGELQRAGAIFEGAATFHGRLFDLGAYPGAVADGAETIAGELYRIPDPRTAFRRLDAVEGPEFRRAALRVHLASGGTRRAWVYLLRARIATGLQ